MLEALHISTADLLYISVVLVAGGLLLWRTLVFLGAVRRGRLVRIDRRRAFDSVPRADPRNGDHEPGEIAREKGVEAIERHFTVMRRVLAPLIIGMTLLLASMPIIAEASSSSASIFGAVLAVVIGLAARPFLENAIAGIVISASRLVRIGDTVRIDDLYGTVEDITATHTAVKVWDWRRYLVPNSSMLQRAFLNHSLYDTLEWANVEFWVSPEADIAAVKEIAVGAALETGLVVGEDAPEFWVKALERDAVCCVVAAWAATATDAWALRSGVRERVLTELRARAIPTMMGRLSLAQENATPPRVGAGAG